MNLTFDELVKACANIGYDLRCGACAELFYTGVRMNPHDEICTTFKENGPPATASNYFPVIVSATATTPATGADRWVGLYADLLISAANIEKERNELLVQAAADKARVLRAEYDRDVARGTVGAIVEGSESWKADCEKERAARVQAEADAAVMRDALQAIASWDPPGSDQAANWLSRTANRGLAADAGKALLADLEHLRKELLSKDAEIESLRECDTCDGGGTFYLDGEPQDCVCMEPFAEKLALMRAEHKSAKELLDKAMVALRDWTVVINNSRMWECLMCLERALASAPESIQHHSSCLLSNADAKPSEAGEVPRQGTKIERSKEWWLARANREGDSPVGAGFLGRDLLGDEPDVMGAGVGHQVARKVSVIKRLGEQIKRQKIHNALITGRLAEKKEVTAQLYVILKEARDNAFASTVESGVSDSRIDYRKGLVARLDAILADKHWGKRSARYLLMMEGLLRYVAMIHPLPWTIDLDWTTEVHDGKGVIIAKYQTVNEAETLIEAGIKLAEEARKGHDEVEAMLQAEIDEESKS